MEELEREEQEFLSKTVMGKVVKEIRFNSYIDLIFEDGTTLRFSANMFEEVSCWWLGGDK